MRWLETCRHPFLDHRPDRCGDRLLDRHRSGATGGARLPDAKQGSAELPKRGRLSVQPVDFHLYRRRKCRGRRIPTELAELVLDVLVGLRRDIPTSPFPLEFSNELPGCCHSSSIPVFAFGFDPPYTVSFNSLAGRKATFLLALILIASPVAGFRPIRAARFRT